MKNQLLTLMLGITVLGTSSAFAARDWDFDGSKKTAVKLKIDIKPKNVTKQFRLWILSCGNEGVEMRPVYDHVRHTWTNRQEYHFVPIGPSHLLRAESSSSNPELEELTVHGYTPTIIVTKVDDLD